MQSPMPVQRSSSPSRGSATPLRLRLPRLDSGLGGWKTPVSASTRAASPWDHEGQSSYTDPAPPSTGAHPPPLRLSLLQHRADSWASTTANAPESPGLVSPLSPMRFQQRQDGSALGIIVPPGTPPVEALPRWLVERQFSRPRNLHSEDRSPSRGIGQRSSVDQPAFTLGGWPNDPRQQLVRTPDSMFFTEDQNLTPHVLSLDSYPFDLAAVSGERVRTPSEPRIRPRPLPRCSSDDITDRRLFRVNAWGEHESPSDASGGLFSLMESQVDPRRGARRLPPSRLASRAPSRSPSPHPE
ncbi:hypothetical protein BDV93DRAFT_605644 [Ceratobasidium sp. AG-I]|nr:hypothetical protein BDV93DRAFT_605644 [Ceratobasidium sp. AG-I]